jgi:hypothetical protein
MYILRERLKTYAKRTERWYKNITPTKESRENIINYIIHHVISVLHNITSEARNKHVHKKKYSDENLKWLSTTCFLAENDDTDKKKYKIESKKTYYYTKNKWNTIIKNNNKEVKKLLNLYFDGIIAIVAIDNKIILPNKLKQMIK